MTFRTVRGLVRVKLRDMTAKTRNGTTKVNGSILNVIRIDDSGPPYGAESWSVGDGWSDDFGGRWLERGNGRLLWEWAE